MATIARWHFEAKFGHKQESISLSKEWDEYIGQQAGLDVDRTRTVTGSAGAREAEVQIVFEIGGLGELDEFFENVASI
jgi:hypothetical protein